MNLINRDDIPFTSRNCGFPYCKSVCENIDGHGKQCRYMMVSYEDIYNMRTVYATDTAEWLHVGNMSVKCSGCEEGYFARTPHCPFCGRLMKNPAPRSMTREEFRKEYDTIFFTKETER